ncbi:MAG TPA: hypothetical protein VFE88_04785 [Candidatus Nanoarchaeia archaeon]|nr:hypothetical protein [Candidatus Nanoarchaeia archaeon]
MKKTILHKWRCTVCKGVEESFEKPEKCSYCNAQSHKIKRLSYSVKTRHHADEPEAYD